MGLNQYQVGKLVINREQYNFARLENRGGVLYAPYVTHGVWQFIKKMFVGARADLIGKNSMLLRGQRGIKFCANGYHCVRVGRYTYYADAMGRAISKNEFMKNKNC